MSTTTPSFNPWPRLVEIANHLHRLYAPGDHSVELARADIRMILEATRRAITVLQDAVGEQNPDGDVLPEPESAVADLLGVYHMVLRGLYGDMANAAHSAAELAGEIAALHGPE